MNGEAFANYKGCKQAREWYVSQSEKCRNDPTVDRNFCAGLVDLANEIAFKACHEKRGMRLQTNNGPSERAPVGKDAKANIQRGAKTPGLDQFDGLGPNYVAQGAGSTGVRGAGGSAPTARTSSTQTSKTFSPGVQDTATQQTFKTFSPGVMDTSSSKLK